MDVSLIDKILSRKTFDINVTDSEGNDILTRLLKKGQYEIVLKHIKDKRWDVNHQNNDGDTFAHILFSIKNYVILDIFKELTMRLFTSGRSMYIVHINIHTY